MQPQSGYRYISSLEMLTEFCQRARLAGSFAIDTEFVRRKTYFANLGLVQLNVDGETFIIDPLIDIDLTALWQLIADPDVVTVLHAGGEDIELFYHQSNGQKPRAVFDTQIAAGFIGMGSSLGYASLVEQLFDGVTLDKSQSRTDWLKRPLSEEQLTYAAADVSYLNSMYPWLVEQVAQAHVADIVVEESQLQVSKRTQVIPRHLLYLFVGNAWQLNQKQLQVMKALAAWRLDKAMSENMPLGFIFKDGVLLELARKMPQSKSDLYKIKDLAPMTRKYSGEAIIEQIGLALAVDPSQWPQTLQRLDDMPNYKMAFSGIKKAAQGLASLLGIDTALVTSRKQINDFLMYHWQFSDDHRAELPRPDLQQGWRWRALESELKEYI
ncbi:MAG TPA: ribonuclease D [Idiomarina baltica]|jgi:ribonuclease D|uniref:Ribonuclease D n=2 Tax=Idiomarina baltica TaxID=190892 RepID=A0A348WPR3_9GAMM|nr:ribonuclease D [Idiomarinaceae bacterium]MBR38134.1 ribonuclease D [Idiomarina sp.]HAR56525.1 ribonuclease D [Idiomarina baltica]|tara:strand:- start:1993 stop:3138 length:1146 start_codon:yes stop_codon:yes gene_type:complete